MNIGIFETEHFEGSYPVIRLFDVPGNNITIFTDHKTHHRFQDLLKQDASRYQWIIGDENGNRFSFFQKMYLAAKKCNLDILYLNTISKNHLLYGLLINLLRGVRIIITVHDINCLFDSTMSGSMRQRVQHLGKQLILKQGTEFNVVADTMVPYLAQKKAHIKIHNVPGAVFENRNKCAEINTHLYLVVPGSIDKKRRNYQKVFELLEFAEKINLMLHINLLGGANDDYGMNTLFMCQSFSGNTSSITYYQDPVVDQDEFDKQLDDAHFIFIPSVVNTQICDGIPETYGLTKSSGNIFDVIKHAKPFIAPKELTVSPELIDSRFAYESIPDLAEFLKSLLQNPEKYTKWRETALANSEKFTIEKIRARNRDLFEK